MEHTGTKRTFVHLLQGGATVDQLNAWAWTQHYKTPNAIQLLSTHHMEHKGMHYVCAHATWSARGIL